METLAFGQCMYHINHVTVSMQDIRFQVNTFNIKPAKQNHPWLHIGIWQSLLLKWLTSVTSSSIMYSILVKYMVYTSVVAALQYSTCTWRPSVLTSNI